jgi:hypothetical protein
MRLLKLIAYGLFGYALYEFVRGMIQLEEQQRQGGGGRSMGGGGGGGQQRRVESFGGQQNMTGPAEGQEVETQEADGGGMKHKVGRGVVSR